MSIDIDLSGSVAIVTGAAGGIGRATARLLLDAGATVAVTDIDATAANEAARALGSGACPLTLDVTDRDQVTAAVRETEQHLGPVDILVNNAFTATVGRFLDLEPDAVDRTLAVILVGSMNTCRAVLPGMIERRRGRIVNVISEAGRVGEAGMAAYSAAKAGLAGFTKAIAKEVAASGVTVNGLSPGATRTATTLTQLAELGADERSLAAGYPMRRLAEPEEIADGILWLASPRASFVTGQIVSVNGGYAC